MTAKSSCRFDLFLDANYPISPPKMSFVLDGNDNETYSFNPNLHRGGGGKSFFHTVQSTFRKVTLSLIEALLI